MDIFLYTVHHLDTYSCRCFSRLSTRFAPKLGESIRNGIRGEVWTRIFLGENPWTTFFLEKASPVHSKSLPVRSVFFLDPVGLQSETLEETSGKIFYWSFQIDLGGFHPPLPGSTGSSEGLVGSTPNFFGACRFFFSNKGACTTWDFFFSTQRLALPTRVWEPARCCPWL